jgi:hypothetical protein
LRSDGVARPARLPLLLDGKASASHWGRRCELLLAREAGT